MSKHGFCELKLAENSRQPMATCYPEFRILRQIYRAITYTHAHAHLCTVSHLVELLHAKEHEI